MTHKIARKVVEQEKTSYFIKIAEPENSKVRGEGTEEADTNKGVKNMILVDNQSHESEDQKEYAEINQAKIKAQARKTS